MFVSKFWHGGGMTWNRNTVRLGCSLLMSLVVGGCTDNSVEPNFSPGAPVLAKASSVANLYVADFVSTAATGVAMNAAGDVAGTSYPDPGCGPFCLPTLETVVWRGGTRTVLPPVAGLSGITARAINASGWVAGAAGYVGINNHAVVWIPNGSSYTPIDLGTLPGTTISDVAGIDDQGRVVGWSTTTNFPPNGSPFMWSQATGMVDLSSQGFPDEAPLAVSPAGAVATPGFWYQLGNSASVTAMPTVPSGFSGPGAYSTAINDVGDQGRFLVSTSSQNLVYPFRFTHGAGWQQISSLGTGQLSNYGIGSINNAEDVSLTALSTGLVAAGPSGLAQSLAPLLSPAYGAATIGIGGPMNNAGQILTRIMIGKSERLMRLVPATSCGSNCIRVSSIQMQGKFVEDPAHPGECYAGGSMYNRVSAKVTVTSEAGVKLAGVQVNSRFLDDYWTNRVVSGTTNATGVVKFTNQGPCGVGTVAILVETATSGSRTFDRTAGVVTGSVIPK
jgi:probable HAF family extracellular repeat protein